MSKKKTRITTNFFLEDLCRTNTGFANIPTEADIANMFLLCYFIAQPVRDKFGRLYENSCFRNIHVNIKIGGGYGSQHLTASALDFYPMDADIDKVFAWIARSKFLRFGQAILESRKRTDGTFYRWIHISLPRYGRTNQELLVSTKPGKYKPYLIQPPV